MKRKISTAQLTSMLQDIKGAKFATIVMETEPTMRKRNNPYFGDVVKRTQVNVTVNFNYGNSLRRKFERENPGKKAPAVTVRRRTWGERIGKTCFILHEGSMYMEVKLNGKPSKVSYTHAGAPIDAALLTPYLPVAKAPQAVPMCDVRINNIREIKVNGVHYEIV